MNRAKIKPDKTQLRTYTPPDLDDKWFQLFTYGRYRAPHRAQLSDFQQRIYNLKRLGMEAAQIVATTSIDPPGSPVRGTRKWTRFSLLLCSLHCISDQ